MPGGPFAVLPESVGRISPGMHERIRKSARPRDGGAGGEPARRSGGGAQGARSRRTQRSPSHWMMLTRPISSTITTTITVVSKRW